jgi:transcriptional regulator with PAS, ATPase and Fis domain
MESISRPSYHARSPNQDFGNHETIHKRASGRFRPQLISILGGWPSRVRFGNSTRSAPLHSVADGTFRQDLYYRLNVFPVSLPPLRERTDDIPLLVEDLIERYAKTGGKKITNIDRSTLELFKAYDWPGNVREQLLDNCLISRVVIKLCGVQVSDTIPERSLSSAGKCCLAHNR